MRLYGLLGGGGGCPGHALLGNFILDLLLDLIWLNL